MAYTTCTPPAGDKITIASKSSNLAELLIENKKKSIDYGILIHSVLAQITHADEIEKAAQPVLLAASGYQLL